jgi:hypothetical protein
MPTKPREPFQVSYIGDQYSFDGGPPRSAKLVAAVSWGWAPGHDRAERNLLCTDRKRTGWTLWGKAYDDWDSFRWMYAKLAWGAPYRGNTVRWAAEQLLTAAWSGERDGYGSDLRGAHIDQEGLLMKDDIKRIEHEVFDALEVE